MRLALACAALLLALSCAQHVSFREMSSNGKATGVKFDTGYEERVLQYIWRTYRTRLVNAVRGYEGFRVAVRLRAPELFALRQLQLKAADQLAQLRARAEPAVAVPV